MATVHVENLSSATPEVYATNLSAGDYDVMIQAADPVQARSGSQGIKFDLLVENGPMQVLETSRGPVEHSPVGRHIFTTSWIPSSSQKDGGDFCRARLAKICEVTGVAQSDDLDLAEFVGKRCKVRNKPQTGDDGVERDDIIRWRSL